MNKEKIKQQKKKRRRNRVRAKIKGTAKRPRLSVFKSNKGMILQLIDDDQNTTLVGAQSFEIKGKDKKTAIGFKLGKLIAQRAIDKKIKIISFDRGGNKYHGRVKAVADGAREGGLEF